MVVTEGAVQEKQTNQTPKKPHIYMYRYRYTYVHLHICKQLRFRKDYVTVNSL